MKDTIRNIGSKLANILFGGLAFILLTILGYGMTLVAVLAAILIIPFAALSKVLEIFTK